MAKAKKAVKAVAAKKAMKNMPAKKAAVAKKMMKGYDKDKDSM